MAKRDTNQKEAHSNSVTDIENVSRERITGLIGVLELRDKFVTAPNRYFPRISIRRMITPRNSEIDEIVFRGSLSTREVFSLYWYSLCSDRWRRGEMTGGRDK